jgi:hypothetical protein
MNKQFKSVLENTISLMPETDIYHKSPEYFKTKILQYDLREMEIHIFSCNLTKTYLRKYINTLSIEQLYSELYSFCVENIELPLFTNNERHNKFFYWISKLPMRELRSIITLMKLEK